jgi:hypothetical protein
MQDISTDSAAEVTRSLPQTIGRTAQPTGTLYLADMFLPGFIQNMNPFFCTASLFANQRAEGLRDFSKRYISTPQIQQPCFAGLIEMALLGGKRRMC